MSMTGKEFIYGTIYVEQMRDTKEIRASHAQDTTQCSILPFIMYQPYAYPNSQNADVI